MMDAEDHSRDRGGDLPEPRRVAWAYGLRTRCGGDLHRFTPLIGARCPIAVGEAFSGHFRTTVDGQEWVRLELLIGGPRVRRSAACELLLLRRLKLPVPLPRGCPVVIHLERVGREGLRLGLEIPRFTEFGLNGGGSNKCWWTLDDERGFQHLLEAADPFIEEPEAEGIEAMRLGAFEGEIGVEGIAQLIEGCKRLWGRLRMVLTDQEVQFFDQWIEGATAALEAQDSVELGSYLRDFVRAPPSTLHGSRLGFADGSSTPELEQSRWVLLLGGLFSVAGAASRVEDVFLRLALQWVTARTEIRDLVARFEHLAEEWRFGLGVDVGEDDFVSSKQVGSLFRLLKGIPRVLSELGLFHGDRQGVLDLRLLVDTEVEFASANGPLLAELEAVHWVLGSESRNSFTIARAVTGLLVTTVESLLERLPHRDRSGHRVLMLAQNLLMVYSENNVGFAKEKLAAFVHDVFEIHSEEPEDLSQAVRWAERQVRNFAGDLFFDRRKLGRGNLAGKSQILHKRISRPPSIVTGRWAKELSDAVEIPPPWLKEGEYSLSELRQVMASGMERKKAQIPRVSGSSESLGREMLEAAP